MDPKLRLLKSKQNLLNAHIANLHDSGLFNPVEIAELSAPMVPQIQDLQEQIRQLNNQDKTESSTPQTVN